MRANSEYCRLTYEASLAELTSLEEMLRSMMEDEQIHQDVINKLWQVYSEWVFHTVLVY
jgi:condensin complex subunit 1